MGQRRFGARGFPLQEETRPASRSQTWLFSAVAEDAWAKPAAQKARPAFLAGIKVSQSLPTLGKSPTAVAPAGLLNPKTPVAALARSPTRGLVPTLERPGTRPGTSNSSMRGDTADDLRRKQKRSVYISMDGEVTPMRRGLSSPTTLAQRRSQRDRTRTMNSDAIDCDKKFQAELRERWRRELGSDDQGASVYYRQKCQFFDFLCAPSRDELVPGADRYTKLVGDVDAKSLELEICHAPPVVTSIVFELTPRQVSEVRQVLKLFAQNSRVAARSGSAKAKIEQERRYAAILEDATLYAERVSQPAFCRFLVDSKLVACGPGCEGRPPFHLAVRFFDIAAARELADSKVRDKDAHSLNPGVRSVSVDRCLEIVATLIGLAPGSDKGLSDSFESGMEQARSTLSAINVESQKRAQKVVTAAEKGVSEELQAQRRREFHLACGSPPPSFTGSMRDWQRGIQSWVEGINDQFSAESMKERCDQQHMLDCFLRDTLVEPGVIHVCIKFHHVFDVLFSAYRDEERIKYEKNGSESAIPHMTFAAFFRFCLDFKLFPTLSSFDEVRAGYRSAECVNLLGKPLPPKAISWQDETRKLLEASISLAKGQGRLKERRHSAASLSQYPAIQSRRGSNASITGKDSMSALKSALPNTGGSEAPSPTHCHGGTTAIALNIPALPARATGSVRGSNSRQGLVNAFGMGTTQEGGAQQKLRDVAAWSTSEDEEGRSGSRTRGAEVKRSFSTQAGERNRETLPASPGTSSRKVTPREKNRGAPLRRIKVSTDWTWVRKPFDTMSEVQLNTYGLLVALNDCVQDCFLHVRGLVKATGLADAAGYLNSDSWPKVLEFLHVEHKFTQDQLKAVAELIDPGANFSDPSLGPGLDSADLEKAVDCVREDFHKRKLVLPLDMAASSRRGGLGEEARRLSSDAKDAIVSAVRAESEASARDPTGKSEEQDAGEHVTPDVKQETSDEEPRVAFGLAAFIETLLLLGFAHLFRDGVAVKASAPGGIKGLWVMTFLSYQFTRLLEAPRGSASLSPEAKKRNDIKKNFDIAGRPVTPLSPSWADSKGDSSSAGSFFFADRTGDPEVPPSGARYVSCLERLHRDHVNLFDGVLSQIVHPAPSGPGAQSNDGSDCQAREVCSHCRRSYPTSNALGTTVAVGSMFCHKCSGVDDQPLSKCVLFPLLERRKLKNVQAIRSDESDRNQGQDDSPRSSLSSTSVASARSTRKEPRAVDLDVFRRQISAGVNQPTSTRQLSLPLPTRGTDLLLFPKGASPREYGQQRA